MHQVSTSKIRHIFNIACFALFIIGMGVYFIAAPKMHDDYWFMIGLRPWYEAQGMKLPDNGGDIFSYGVPWKGIWQTWEAHYLRDNARLTNIFATVFLILPKWVGSGLMTLLLAWSFILMMRILNMDFRSRLVPFALIMWACLFPWHDTFGSLVFQFNYVLPGWASLMLLLFLKRRVEEGRPASSWWVFILSLGIGLIHEGFSVSLSFSLIALAIFFREWRRPFVFAAAAGLFAGAVALLAVPGMLARFIIAVRPYMKLQAVTKFVVSLKLCFFICLIVLILRLIYTNSGVFRSYVRGSFLPIFSGVAVGVFVLIRPISGGGDRVAYWMCVCLTMLVLHTSRLLFNRYRQYILCIPGVRRVAPALVASILVLSGLRLYNFDIAALDLHKEMGLIRDMVMHGKDGARRTFYLSLPYDTFDAGETNLIRGGFYNNGMTFYNSYLNAVMDVDTVGSFGGAVPASLRRVTAESGVPVGNAGNIRKVGKEYFVVNPEKCVYLVDPYHFIYVSIQGDHRSDNKRVNGWFYGIRFYSEADGKRYMWLYRKTKY